MGLTNILKFRSSNDCFGPLWDDAGPSKDGNSCKESKDLYASLLLY